VTLKGQGCDPNILRAHYLENGWRYTLGDNGAPVGMKWSRDPESSRREHNTCMLRAHRLSISKMADFVTMEDIKFLPGMTSHDPEGQGRHTKMFCAQYLKHC